jgi:hypothetical protein
MTKSRKSPLALLRRDDRLPDAVQEGEQSSFEDFADIDVARSLSSRPGALGFAHSSSRRRRGS